MPEDPNPQAGGAPGEQPTAEAGSSPTSDAELLASLEKEQPPAAPEIPPEVASFLEKADPEKLPQSLRSKLEAPFLSQYGKKTTELEQRRQADNERLFGLVEKMLATKNGDQQTLPDQREELRQKLAEGDVTAVEGLMERMFQDRYGRQMEFISNKQAIETAAQLMPELPKYEPQVAEALTQDKELLYMATVNNRQFAPKVLAGLAWRADALAVRKERDELKASIPALVKQGIEDYKRELRGLPKSTSQAGKTPTGFTAEKTSGFSDKELMEKSWAEAQAASQGH